MGKMIISGGGGITLDEVTGTPSDLIKGKNAYLQGSDEPQMGTLELTGNATAAYVYSGKTFYSTDPKLKLTGTMTVNSILSFSAQAYSGRQVLLKWQNPYAATGKPFSGIHVWYSTSGYPGAGGGTWIYSGYGGNAASGGWCQAVVTLPNLSTTYYFTACSYVTCSAGDMWGTAFNAAAATSADQWLTFTWSQNYTVPGGYQAADICCVGGGAGSGMYSDVSGGGGGGYVTNSYGLGVSGGQVLTIVIGAGGVGAKAGGGASYIANMASANGAPSLAAITRHGGNGGSGGGAGGGGILTEIITDLVQMEAATAVMEIQADPLPTIRQAAKARGPRQEPGEVVRYTPEEAAEVVKLCGKQAEQGAREVEEKAEIMITQGTE